MDYTSQNEPKTEVKMSKPSSIILPNDDEINLHELSETKLIEALHDFMECHDDDVANEVIADVIGTLEAKYKSHTEASSFDDCLQLTQFTFEDESVDSLIDAIHHFEPAANEFSGPQASTKPLIIRCQDVVTEVSRDFFELKLRQTIDKMYQRPADYAIDEQYIRIQKICMHSRMAFRYFSEKLAQTMIDHEYPTNMQVFLDQFLLDIRIRLNSTEDFCRMYPTDLYFHVRVLTEAGFDSQTESNATVDGLLLSLRSNNFLKFVMLATHFKMFHRLQADTKTCENHEHGMNVPN